MLLAVRKIERHFGCGHWGAGEFWTPQKSTRRLNAREVLTSDKARRFHTPIRGWSSKIVWKRWCPRIHSEAGPPCREWRSLGRFHGNSEMSQPTDEQKITQKPAVTLGQWKMISLDVSHVEPRVSPLCAERRNIPNPTEIHSHLKLMQSVFCFGVLCSLCSSSFGARVN